MLLSDKQILNLPLVLFSGLAIMMPIVMAPVYAGVLEYLGAPDFTTISYLGFSITIFGLLFPYAFLMTWGCPPRYTIHLLPLALLPLSFFANNFIDGMKFRSKVNC